MAIVNESKLINEAFSDQKVVDRLIGSSVSNEDARIRMGEYKKLFSRYNDLKEFNENTKMFSGYAETPLLSTQYFNASVASYVSSFAGFMSIERDFDQPNGLFYWFDVLGVTDYRSVIPNLGADNFENINSTGRFEADIQVTAGTAYDYMIGRKIIPGTLRIKVLKKNGTKFELVDAGQGEFMAKAGVITASQISYANGQVKFTLGTALTPNDDVITVVGAEDVCGTPSNLNGAAPAKNENRFLAKMQQIGLSTVPDMLTAEYNIAALGAMKKATGSDMATFLFNKLRELYTKIINQRLVKTLVNSYVGNTYEVQMQTGIAGYHDYRSSVDFFNAELINIESELASKAVKGVTVTAYIGGMSATNQFQKGASIGKWEKNTKMTYINDLLGWYDGVPVLRSNDVPANDFYAIHKTADGQMAPLARGIYMPLTDTPTIGNYNNPTQMAAGIYYQEGIKSMAPELVQKCTIINA